MAVERVDYESDFDYEMALAQEEYDNMTEDQRQQMLMDEYYTDLAKSMTNDPMPESAGDSNSDDIPF